MKFHSNTCNVDAVQHTVSSEPAQPFATAASQILTRFAGAGSRLLMTYVAIRMLGADVYAAWLLASALGLYASQTLGVPQALVDIAARERTGNHARLASAFWHATGLLSATALLLAPTVFVLAQRSDPQFETQQLFGACVLVSAFSLPLTPIRGLAEGLQDAPALNIRATAGTLIGTAIGIAGLAASHRPAWLLGPLVGGTIVAPIAYLHRLLRLVPALARMPAWSWRSLGSLLRPSTWFFIIGIAWTVIYATDVWVLHGSGLSTHVAAYGLTFALFSSLGEPLAAVVAALRPRIVTLANERDGASLYATSVRGAFAGSAFLNGIGLFAYPWIVYAWGSGRVPPVLGVAFVLAGYQTLRAAIDPSAWLVVPRRGPRALALALAIDAVVNLTASLVLARLIGPIGVAVGTMLGTLVGSGRILPRLATAEFGIRATLGAPALLLTAAWWALCGVLAYGAVALHWSALLCTLGAVASIPCAAFLFWTRALSHRDRAAICTSLSSRLGVLNSTLRCDR